VVSVRSAGELLADSVVVSLPNSDVVDKSVAAPEIVVLWSTGELDSSLPSAVEFCEAVSWSPPAVDDRMSAREIVLLAAGELDSPVEFASAVESVENSPVEPDDVVEKSDDAVETSSSADSLDAVDSSSDELLAAVDSSSDELLAAVDNSLVKAEEPVEISFAIADMVVDDSSFDELLAAVDDNSLVKAEELVEISFAIADMVVDDSSVELLVELKASVEKVGDEVASS